MSVESVVSSPPSPHTASAASSVQPPSKRASRVKSVCSSIEQTVAPVDRRAERLSALGLVAGAAGEQVEALLEPREERLRRQELRAGRRELDRQREPVEPHADLGHRGRVRVGDRKVRFHGTRALDEQPDGLIL